MDKDVNYNNLSDEELIALAQNGDNFAEDLLIKRYKYVATSFAHRYFLNGGDSEDLLQEGFLAVFRAIHTFNGKANFKTYVYACVKNRINTVIKTSNRYKNQPLNNYLSLSSLNDGDKTEIIIDTTFDPEDRYINDESERELQIVIKDTLSDYEYQILSCYLKGFSYLEIAEKFSKQVKSIDNALQRIRKKLLAEVDKNK